MLNLTKRFLSILLAVVMLMSIYVPVKSFANDNKCIANPLKKYENMKIVKSKELTEIATKKFNTLFKNKKIEYRKESFDFNNIKVAKINNSIYATISKKDSILSTVTISLDENNNIYTETYFYNKNGNFWIKTKQNSKIINDIDSEIKFISNEEIIKGINELNRYSSELQNRSLDVTCFTAITGAGGTVSGLIAKVCGMPCTLAPPLCAVCLGGIIVIGGGSILTAVWKCWK